MRKILIAVFLSSVVIWLSCTKDSFVQTVENCDEIPTYNTNMVALVDTYCAYSGCHDGSSAPGDYTSFTGMQRSGHFESEFNDRVVSKREDPNSGMPPDYATGPLDLSEEDFKLFNCWINEGFPEN